MPTLLKRQTDNLGMDETYDYHDYNSQRCYEAGDCSWWWSNVSSSPPISPIQNPQINTLPSSQTGSAVRYTIVAILFFLLFAYFIGGYWHARHRVRKNLPPLAYHRWMVKRRSAHYPRYWGGGGVPMYASHPHHPHNNPYYMQQPQHPDYYGMQGSTHAPPPPAYHAGDAPPPVYQPPPQGGSKVAADQNYSEVRREDGEGGSSEQGHGGAGRPV